MNIGLEYHAADKDGNVKTMYLTFANAEERDILYDAMRKLVAENCVTADSSILEHTEKWVKGGLSNFDYLLLLNSYAQRSFQDIT